MNLVDQIFAQANLGTAPDPNANPFATGVQLGQNQQRINLAKQQLAQELAMQPLKQTLMQQESEMNAFKLQDYLQQRQNRLDITGNWTWINAEVNDQLAKGDVQAAQQAYLQAGAQDARLFEDQRYVTLGKRLDTIMEQQTNAQYKAALGEAAQARAESAANRALYDQSRLDLSQQRLSLDREISARKDAEFQLKKSQLETRMTPEQRILFGQALKAESENLSLINDPDAKIRRMEELAAKAGVTLGGLTPTPPPTPPSTNALAPGSKRVGNFIIRPK